MKCECEFLKLNNSLELFRVLLNIYPQTLHKEIERRKLMEN